ncbi:hypothetical protein K474DRAFT_1710578 [Panus rudis PR-1116 ss-1]|nr:hypothetical protein K474DRAFT_1710578 [Panus rudis PR-1116 ss-1]
MAIIPRRAQREAKRRHRGQNNPSTHLKPWPSPRQPLKGQQSLLGSRKSRRPRRKVNPVFTPAEADSFLAGYELEFDVNLSRSSKNIPRVAKVTSLHLPSTLTSSSQMFPQQDEVHLPETNANHTKVRTAPFHYRDHIALKSSSSRPDPGTRRFLTCIFAEGQEFGLARQASPEIFKLTLVPLEIEWRRTRRKNTTG